MGFYAPAQLVRDAREHGVEVRFIEFMPLDAQGHWMSDAVVGQDEIVATISAVFPLEQMPSRGAAPAYRCDTSMVAAPSA